MGKDVKATTTERSNRYGGIEDVSTVNEDLMDVIRSSPKFHELTATHRSCLYMITHKIARMVCGDINYTDNPHDIAGYATILENYMEKQNEL